MNLDERLKLIAKQKGVVPDSLKNIIKSDFYYLISNYFEVGFEDIDIEIKQVNDKYKVCINCLGDRLKFVHTLP